MKNQYLDVLVSKGEVQEAIVRDRWVSMLTFGISRYFTDPYIYIYIYIMVAGEDNTQIEHFWKD